LIAKKLNQKTSGNRLWKTGFRVGNEDRLLQNLARPCRAWRIPMPSTLITGANRGLGLEFARQYSANGWQVYATCRDPTSASELRRLADAGGSKLRILPLDVTKLASVKAAAEELKKEAIDLLINNAGVGGPHGQSVGNIDYDAWAEVLNVNTLGPIRVAEAFVDNVGRSARKLIVTLTSGMGSIGDNTSGGAFAYRSSKAAVNMVMRSLAIDLAPRGISCIVVNPGWVLTDMGGPNAKMTPSESVAKMRRLINAWGPTHSGKFFNHDRSEYAWLVLLSALEDAPAVSEEWAALTALLTRFGKPAANRPLLCGHARRRSRSAYE
jgi:NAD(P)-dependent dehydrogenase (short-subunit alcohol dehydrogenase family)